MSMSMSPTPDLPSGERVLWTGSPDVMPSRAVWGSVAVILAGVFLLAWVGPGPTSSLPFALVNTIGALWCSRIVQDNRQRSNTRYLVTDRRCIEWIVGKGTAKTVSYYPRSITSVVQVDPAAGPAMLLVQFNTGRFDPLALADPSRWVIRSDVADAYAAIRNLAAAESRPA